VLPANCKSRSLFGRSRPLDAKVSFRNGAVLGPSTSLGTDSAEWDRIVLFPSSPASPSHVPLRDTNKDRRPVSVSPSVANQKLGAEGRMKLGDACAGLGPFRGKWTCRTPVAKRSSLPPARNKTTKRGSPFGLGSRMGRGSTVNPLLRLPPKGTGFLKHGGVASPQLRPDWRNSVAFGGNCLLAERGSKHRSNPFAFYDFNLLRLSFHDIGSI